MRQSAITPATTNGQAIHNDVGLFYPYSAQYKGDGWYVFNASTNRYGIVKYETAVAAERAAEKLKAEDLDRV